MGPERSPLIVSDQSSLPLPEPVTAVCLDVYRPPTEDGNKHTTRIERWEANGYCRADAELAGTTGTFC